MGGARVRRRRPGRRRDRAQPDRRAAALRAGAEAAGAATGRARKSRYREDNDLVWNPAAFVTVACVVIALVVVGVLIEALYVPSRKQRRQREKLQRHEYEYVLETDEGEEIPVESPRAAEVARGTGRPRRRSPSGRSTAREAGPEAVAPAGAAPHGDLRAADRALHLLHGPGRVPSPRSSSTSPCSWPSSCRSATWWTPSSTACSGGGTRTRAGRAARRSGTLRRAPACSLAPVVTRAGPGSEEEQELRARSRLRTEWRSSGSKRASVPAGASTSSSPARKVATPSTTTIQACSFTWWSPSSWPGVEPDEDGPGLVVAPEDDRRPAPVRRLDLARASRSPSRRQSSTAERVPPRPGRRT